MTGLSWSCLSALVSPTLPCLRLLDLRWCEGIKDMQIKEIVCPPGESLALRERPPPATKTITNDDDLNDQYF